MLQHFYLIKICTEKELEINTTRSWSGVKQRSFFHHFTKDGDPGKSPKALIWTVCDLRPSLGITEVDEEYFLSLWFRVIQDEEDNLGFILTSLQGHYSGLQLEVLILRR